MLFVAGALLLFLGRSEAHVFDEDPYTPFPKDLLQLANIRDKIFVPLGNTEGDLRAAYWVADVVDQRIERVQKHMEGLYEQQQKNIQMNSGVHTSAMQISECKKTLQTLARRKSQISKKIERLRSRFITVVPESFWIEKIKEACKTPSQCLTS